VLSTPSSAFEGVLSIFNKVFNNQLRRKSKQAGKQNTTTNIDGDQTKSDCKGTTIKANTNKMINQTQLKHRTHNHGNKGDK